MKLLTSILTISVACGLAPRLVADSIRLLPTATVDTTPVTLADVAALDGPAAEAFATTQVARPDGSAAGVDVDLADLRRVLTDAGADWSALTLAGHRRCAVTFQREAHVANDAPPAAPAHAHGIAGPLAAEAGTDPRRLADLIRDRLAELAGVPADRLEITYPTDPARVAMLSGTVADARYELIPTSRDGLGRVPVRVIRHTPDGRTDESLVTVDVARRAAVVTAAYDVRRDERFTEANLKVREVLLTAAPDDTFADAHDVIGKRAETPLREGAVIRAGDLAEDLLVVRGELVTVTVVRGRLVVRSVARATQDAGLGEPVALRHDDTRETFHATVTGRRAATIQPAVTQAAAAR